MRKFIFELRRRESVLGPGLGLALLLSSCSPSVVVEKPRAENFPKATVSASPSIPDPPVTFEPDEPPRRDLFELSAPLPAHSKSVETLVMPDYKVLKEAPYFELKNLEQELITPDDYQGQLLLLNFWATWCAPCLAELPYFEKLSRDFGPIGLDVANIAVFDREAAVTKILNAKNLQLDVLLDPNGLSLADFGFTSVPAVVIVDRAGFLVEFPDPETGELTTEVSGSRDWLHPEFVEFLRRYLQ